MTEESFPEGVDILNQGARDLEDFDKLME